MSPVNLDPPQGLSLAVLRFVRYLQGQRRGDSGVTLTQLSALHSLADGGPMTPTQLAERERVQAPSMTRLLGKLHDLELVARRAHPTDGRQMIVALTEAGERAIAAEEHEQWLADQLRALTADDRATLANAAAILNRIRMGDNAFSVADANLTDAQ